MENGRADTLARVLRRPSRKGTGPRFYRLRTDRNNHHFPPFHDRKNTDGGLHPSVSILRRKLFWPAVILFFGGLFTATLFEIRTVRGTSMEPKYPSGTTVLAFRWAYGLQLPIINRYLVFWKAPSPGDDVLFYHPVHLRESLKRVLAGPGGNLTLNDQGLATPDGILPLTGYQREGMEPLLRVPENRIFVIGLNWPASTDSRDYGPLPIAYVTSLVVCSWR